MKNSRPFEFAAERTEMITELAAAFWADAEEELASRSDQRTFTPSDYGGASFDDVEQAYTELLRLGAFEILPDAQSRWIELTGEMPRNVIGFRNRGFVRVCTREKLTELVCSRRRTLATEIVNEELRESDNVREGNRLAALIGITDEDKKKGRKIQLSDSAYRQYKNMPDTFFAECGKQLSIISFITKLCDSVNRISIDAKRHELTELNEIMLSIRSLPKVAKPAAVRGREAIPENVRHEVWRRDGGKCVICGFQERLEFDHIIPLSKGGSNTARNLQLLCEHCNRKKRDSV
jgi:hypothetical protein